MGTLGKFLAAICAVLFIFSSVVVIVLFNIERKALDAATYKEAFQTQGLYQRIPALLATTLANSISQNPNAIPLIKALTVSDWETNISTLLPPDELKTVADNALDATFDYLKWRNGFSGYFSHAFKDSPGRRFGAAGCDPILEPSASVYSRATQSNGARIAGRANHALQPA